MDDSITPFLSGKKMDDFIGNFTETLSFFKRWDIHLQAQKTCEFLLEGLDVYSLGFTVPQVDCAASRYFVRLGADLPFYGVSRVREQVGKGGG